jgi:hypothetical protein
VLWAAVAGSHACPVVMTACSCRKIAAAMIATQLGREPGDQDSVFLIGLIAGQTCGPRAHEVTISGTHTNGIDRSAAS